MFHQFVIKIQRRVTIFLHPTYLGMIFS